MELELGIVHVKEIVFGEQTCLEKGLLSIDREALVEKILLDDHIASVQVELARPGESVRIVPVKDVIEPRAKMQGEGTVFPGVLDHPMSCGKGKTLVLEGVCVTTTGQMVGFQEGLIDMSGPGADLCPFSSRQQVVLVIEPQANISKSAHEKAVREAGIKAAAYLAEAVCPVKPDEIRSVRWNLLEPDYGLPRIVYIYQVLAQGLLHDNYLYGLDAKKTYPTLISPNELMDGALISGNCVTACDKNTTFDHMNNPVVEELLARHQKDLFFGGLILHPVSPSMDDKERNSTYAVSLAEQLGAQGVIITEEGGGNPETDLMLLCKKAEEKKIQTVLFLHENAGEDGRSEGITYTTPKADCVVTVGNTNEIVHLPAVDKVLGQEAAVEELSGSFLGARLADGSMKVPYAVIIDSVSNLGMTRMRAEDR